MRTLPTWFALLFFIVLVVAEEEALVQREQHMLGVDSVVPESVGSESDTFCILIASVTGTWLQRGPCSRKYQAKSNPHQAG